MPVGGGNVKKKLFALLFGTALVLAACGGNGDAGNDTASEDNGTTTASAGNAEKLFDQKCSSCHGGNLEGGVGPKLSNIGASLSQEEIETVIAEGKGAMPHGLLEGEDATAVAEWLSTQK
jgi:cytochrome c551